MGTVASIRRFFHDGSYVMIDVKRTGVFIEKDWQREENWPRLRKLELQFGQVVGACASSDKHDFEYTVRVEKGCTECVEEEYVARLFLPELKWVSAEHPNAAFWVESHGFVAKGNREAAVWVEAHGERRFVADLLRRSDDQLFELRFVADGMVLKDVPPAHLSEPTELTVRAASPQTLEPDPLWLLDRKIQANIDARWPMHMRIREALKRLQRPRPASQPALGGSFVGKDLFDSEGFPAHPAPLPELGIGPRFADTWGKFAGKVRFAATYKIGPAYPAEDAWVDRVDAGSPLYFHAALPVHAGLICLGTFPPVNGQPEWVRASDVTLVGVALYAQGELVPGFADPPLDPQGLQKFGHDACHFIPGCVATYKVDCAWVGATFCLAPNDTDFEIRDDIYGIVAYHNLLVDGNRRPHERGSYGTRQLRLEVNLVLSTNYLANVRQVCSGSVKVNLTPHGLGVADERLRHVKQVKLESSQAKNPTRERKVLSKLPDKEAQAAEVRRASMAAVAQQAMSEPEAPPRTVQSSGAARPPPPPSGPRVGPFGGSTGGSLGQ